MKRLSALVLTMLALFASPALAQPAPGATRYDGWYTFNGNLEDQKYSPADQITPENVGKLEKVWEVHTGDVSDGETLRINGAHWAALKRVCVFANIYDGVPNWQKTDGAVLVTMPDQPPIEVRMTDGRNDKRLCGIVMLENDGGRLKATRLTEYVRDQEELDRRFGWGLRWVAGSKD